MEAAALVYGADDICALDFVRGSVCEVRRLLPPNTHYILYPF
jgi:hypothetical protein